MASYPIFAAGAYSKIEPAIEAGILTYPAYVFVSDQNRLAFIDKNLDIQLIKGDDAGGSTRDVERVNELPDIEDADMDVLYIYEDIVYVFTGTSFKPMFVDYSEEIDNFSIQIEEIQQTVTEVSEKVESLEEVVNNITEASSGLIFSTYDDFPEVGVAGQLYIDITEETGGIYTYDEEKQAYLQLSSVEGLGLKFIELGDD